MVGDKTQDHSRIRPTPLLKNCILLLYSLQSKQQLEQLDADQPEPEPIATERILESIEKEEEEDLEAKLAEAISSVPEIDNDETGWSIISRLDNQSDGMYY